MLGIPILGMSSLGSFVSGLTAGLGVFIALKIIIDNLFYIGEPHEVLIFSGRSHKLSDGSVVGFRTVIGGWAFRIPIIERVDRMDLRVMPVTISVEGAFSKGGIPLKVTAVANIKISSNPQVLAAAIEHFLGHARSEIAKVARETLEGHLRGVLATLTPVEVNEDRLAFAQKIEEEVLPDLHKLGLELDTFKIQHISDSEGYLDAIGRKEIEVIKKKASIAESDARRVAENEEEMARGLAIATREQAEREVKKAANELEAYMNRRLAEVTSEEERTNMAGPQARALAEQELQKVRSVLEAERRKVDDVLPAEIQKEAANLNALGKAAYLQKEGEATAKIISMINEVWKSAGDKAEEIYILQQIEDIIAQVVDSIKELPVGEVTALDGGDADAIPSHVRAYPATVAAVLEELKRITGIDVPTALQGAQKKRRF